MAYPFVRSVLDSISLASKDYYSRKRISFENITSVVPGSFEAQTILSQSLQCLRDAAKTAAMNRTFFRIRKHLLGRKLIRHTIVQWAKIHELNLQFALLSQKYHCTALTGRASHGWANLAQASRRRNAAAIRTLRLRVRAQHQLVMVSWNSVIEHRRHLIAAGCARVRMHLFGVIRQHLAAWRSAAASDQLFSDSVAAGDRSTTHSGFFGRFGIGAPVALVTGAISSLGSLSATFLPESFRASDAARFQVSVAGTDIDSDDRAAAARGRRLLRAWHRQAAHTALRDALLARALGARRSAGARAALSDWVAAARADRAARLTEMFPGLDPDAARDRLAAVGWRLSEAAAAAAAAAEAVEAAEARALVGDMRAALSAMDRGNAVRDGEPGFQIGQC